MSGTNKIIAMNMQPLASDSLTGIGYYTANVARILKTEMPYSELQVFDFMGRNDGHGKVMRHLDMSIEADSMHVVKSVPLSVYIRLKKLGRIRPYEKLTHSKADATVFFNYLAPAGVKGKRIITIYDMVCERYPETMQARNRRLLKSNLRASAEAADAIVTISEFSKKEIEDIYGIPSYKIFVAPCGTNTEFYTPFKDEAEARAAKGDLFTKYGIDEYFLYVGTLEPRKNLVTVISAFEKVASENPRVKLVLAGGLGWQSEVTLNAIENSPVKDRIVRTGYVSDEDKRLLYRGALAFVFPSLYEGFGMPVTEAMACGTQCIIANVSSLPEASGGLAYMNLPLDVDGFADSMRAVLSGEQKWTKQELVDNAASFTWEKAAQGYKDAIAFITSPVML